MVDFQKLVHLKTRNSKLCHKQNSLSWNSREFLGIKSKKGTVAFSSYDAMGAPLRNRILKVTQSRYVSGGMSTS